MRTTTHPWIDRTNARATRCEHTATVPGPHPGCIEFAEPETIGCTDPATVRLRVLDPWGDTDDHIRVCARHAIDIHQGNTDVARYLSR